GKIGLRRKAPPHDPGGRAPDAGPRRPPRAAGRLRAADISCRRDRDGPEADRGRRPRSAGGRGGLFSRLPARASPPAAAAAGLPRIEVYGETGSLSVPDPNTCGGPVRLRRPGEAQWIDVPLNHSYSENSRGLGLADMAKAIRDDRPHRASGDLAYHVLDAMQ